VLTEVMTELTPTLIEAELMGNLRCDRLTLDVAIYIAIYIAISTTLMDVI
jgi:hypothetical protein